MKKTIIAILLLLAFQIPALSNDYNGHWAENEIQNLVNRGIVTGDEHGNISPDVSIKRAEFIKVLNKINGFNVKEEDNFADIQPNSWYADEFLIAKKAGYIVGDQFGHANPENNITRAEACVIVSKVFNLYNINEKLEFTDNDLIPEWSLGYIIPMVKLKYILGYNDGSFKANHFLTRAEAFTILSRTEKKEEPNTVQTGSGNVSSIPAISAPVRGPLGGGNGPSNTPLQTKKPDITKYDSKNQKISFVGDENAASYNVKIEVPEVNISKEYTDITFTSTLCELDLSGYLSDVSKLTTLNEFSLVVYVKAIGRGNYLDSAYIKAVAVGISLESLENPILNYTISTENSTEEIIVSWEPVENASEYNVKLFIDDEENSSIVVDQANRTATISDLSLVENKNAVVKVMAISSKPNLRNSTYSEIIPKVSGIIGKGSEEEPYLVRDAEDFKKITDLEGIYYIVRNLDLGECAPIGSNSNPFKGKIIGRLNNTNEKPTINIKINSDQSYQGFISHLSGGTVENIIITGSVAGSQYVGGIAGKVTNGMIKYCINEAEITALNTANSQAFCGGIAGYTVTNTLSSISYCINEGNIIANSIPGSYGNIGGIIGELSENSGSVTKCINRGNITTTGRNIGGIVGLMRSGNTVELCSNYGTLSSVSTSGCVGGIAGNNFVSVSQCFNEGKITAVTNAGGICGSLGSSNSINKITNCYNTGKITATGGNSAGIVFNVGNSSSIEAELTASYNIGDIEATGVARTIYHSINGTNKTIHSNYYLDSVMGSNPSTDAPIALTEDEMKNLIKRSGFDDSQVWEIKVTDGYEYPQLKQYLEIDWLKPAD